MHEAGSSRALRAVGPEDLTRDVDKAPTNPIYLFHLGMACSAAGNPAMAERMLKRSLEALSFAYASDATATLKKISAQRN